MTSIRYEIFPSSKENCGICWTPLSTDISIGHKLGSKVVHPLHRKCVQQTIDARQRPYHCLFCDVPIDTSSLPLSIKERCLKVLKTIGPFGAACGTVTAIIKIVPLVLTVEALFFGAGGIWGAAIGLIINTEMLGNTRTVMCGASAATGAVVGGISVLKLGQMLGVLKENKQLVERIGCITVGGIGGIGGAIGLASAIKALELAKEIIPSLRRILGEEDSRTWSLLQGVAGQFGATLFGGITLRILNKIVYNQ